MASREKQGSAAARSGASARQRRGRISTSTARLEPEHVMPMEDADSGGDALVAAAPTKHSHRVAALRDDTSARAAGVPSERSTAGTKRGTADVEEADAPVDGISDSGSKQRKRARVSAGAAAAVAARAPSEPIVLVKIGADGNDRSLSFTYEALIRMDAAALLEELAKSVRFSVDLKDVPLGKCTVWLLPHVAGKKPTSEDEAAAVQLEGADTIGDVMSSQPWPPARLLFLRVRMPGERGAPPASGHEPLDASMGIPQAIWDTLPEHVQKRALRNKELRSKLATVQPLVRLQEWNAGSSWPSQVVNLMPGATSGALQLGIVRLPSVKESFFDNPKGFEDLLHAPVDFVLDATRMELASHFIRTMTATIHRTNYGVLLSGPNGVGKSAVGLLTFLACYAQGLPVVYISNTASWTFVIQNRETGSDYLLQQFMAQNTDIILANETFRALFLPALRDEKLLTHDLLTRLGHATLNGAPRVGVILDEVQYITQAVEHVSRACSEYFRESWYVWSTATTAPFVRMDIASSHGLREFKLSSGDEHRLRFVKPWSAPIRDAFLSCKNSPGFIADTAARSRAVFVGGGVVRGLLRFKAMIEPSATARSDLASVEADIRDKMEKDSRIWLDTLSADERRESCSVIRSLIQGQTTWRQLKPLYDEGLVELTDAGHVAPVSSMAASVLHSVLAREVRHHTTRILSLPATGERGYALECQLHALLNNVRATIPAQTLECAPAAAVYVCTDFALPFSKIDVTMREHAKAGSVLYLPQSSNYPVDAIIAPKEADSRGKAEAGKLPVLVLEASMTHPRQPRRVEKMLNWFHADGVLTQLADVYADRNIVVVCCYGGDYAAEFSSARKYLEVVHAADAVGVSVVVADRPSLEALGVQF